MQPGRTECCTILLVRVSSERGGGNGQVSCRYPARQVWSYGVHVPGTRPHRARAEAEIAEY